MPMDLCEPAAGDMVAFCTRVAQRAEDDHHAGRKTRPTGRELCNDLTEGYRRGHIRLASAIYNKVRWSLEAAEREQTEAGLR